jgi:defect-in-organelle-trafficking protein DotC
MMRGRRASLLAATILGVGVVWSSHYAAADVLSKEALKGSAMIEQHTESAFEGLRPAALREAALALAIQNAVAAKTKSINEEVKRHASTLDEIYKFRALMLEGVALPPVITEAGSSYAISGNSVVVTERTYRINSPARLVTAPPTWREYLLHTYPATQSVNPALLPKNAKEKALWETAIDEGWQLGEERAVSVFQTNLNRLARDFKGMVTFRRLVAQGMVTMPHIATGNLGIRVGDHQLDVNQTVIRISGATKFMEAGKWTPKIITQTNR